MIGEHGLKNEKEALYIARHEALCTLDDVLAQSAKVLKVKGRFYGASSVQTAGDHDEDV